jgi:predicted N-acetyltransferase YhbS
MGMAQVAALVAAADEIDGRVGLFKFYLEGSHKCIFGQHGHAMAGAGEVKPNGELAVGHGGVILTVRGKRITVHRAGMLRPMDAAAAGWYSAGPMTDLALTILTETPSDADIVERLHERTFGPGRYARTAFRIREGAAHLVDLSFTARIGTLLVGSVRLTPIRVGEIPALLLGPLTVEPPFRRRGIGLALMQRALAEAKQKGHHLVVLVGDEPYYAKAGFRRIPKGQARMPGPVNPDRLLVAELTEGAFAGVSGPIRPEWKAA